MTFPAEKPRLSHGLASRTHHHSRFADAAAIVREKERQGLRVSLCIPTWNEAATIGAVVRTLRTALREAIPLLDDIAVIDSGSTDLTRELAAEAGAEVHLASDILPTLGATRGKGENLWKSLFQLRGDIFCFVDADIENIHPGFVSGLVGPLVLDKGIDYVKAFYDRTPDALQNSIPGGGGRVTEILVRPLLSMFYPELTAFIQPLAGEYAARRSILERIPFPIGYGVEMGHLLDIYRMRGLQVFAQTDVDRRMHRTRSIAGLGKMSFAILQTFFKRLNPPIPTDFSTLCRQFQFSGNGCEAVAEEIVEEERPPMITIPEYREKFQVPPPERTTSEF